MDTIDTALEEWRDTLCQSVDKASLLAGNPTVHKWQATFRALSLREATSWRALDLLYQSKLLTDENQILGARILLRAALETLAVLIRLNQLMRNVVAGALDFHEFSEKTTSMLLGSRDGSTSFQSTNVVTLLKKSDRRYTGLWDIYEGLCETAHPSFEGLNGCYTRIDFSNQVTYYENTWADRFLETQVHGVALCIGAFKYEYNEEWCEAFSALEAWIEENDEELMKEGANLSWEK